MRSGKADPESSVAVAVADCPVPCDSDVCCDGMHKALPLREDPFWGICFASTTFRTLLAREKEKLKPPSGFHGVLTVVAVL